MNMADSKCICFMTDPSTWETYGGATEPGSMYEPNPECPEHFTPEEIAEYRAGWVNVDPGSAPTNARWGR